MTAKRLLTLLVSGAAILGCAPTDEVAFGLGEPCLDDGCGANLVCDDDSQTCRLPLTCDQLACVAHQVCDTLPDSLDEGCLPTCDDGWLWDPQLGVCEQAPSDCVPGGPRSILDQCTAQNRACIPTNLGRAECGPCLDGFVSDGGQCRPRITCEEKQAECDLAGRLCVEPDDGSDARCAACPDDQLETVDGECLPRTCALGARSSVGDACAADFRTCLDDDAVGATCGGCLGGYIEGPDGACRAVRLCADLDCTLRGATCVEGDARTDATCGACRPGFEDRGSRCTDLGIACDALLPDGATLLADACAAEDRACVDDACEGCLDGFVLDPFTGQCRAAITCDDCDAAGIGCAEVGGVIACDPAECADLNKRDPMTGECVPVAGCDALQCAPGEVCSPASGNTDAYCRRDCGDTGVWNGASCAFCPPCDGPGDTGRVFPRPTANGECICETREGYFATRGVQVASFECDGDGDGWLRESARPALRSLDPVIRENARCDVRTVDAFVMINEAGTEHRVALDRPVDLYESDRNDDDLVLARARIRRNFDRPFGAAGDLRLEARHINALTKYCHLLGTDYNDNGVPDVEEFARQPVAPGRSSDQPVFNRFSYFAELHQGYFRPAGDTPQRGQYVVAEKRRVADGPVDARVPLTYGDDADPYWRECKVNRDVGFASPGAVGMDLAEVLDDGAVDVNARSLGMNHHSQFKCVAVAQTDSPRVTYEIPVDWTADTHIVNDCRLDVLGDAAGDPADAGFVCRTAGRAPPGQVRWAAIPFEPYANDVETYRRGCVDECDELRAGRLGVDPCDFGPEVLRLPCAGDIDAFGRLLCYEACDERDNDGNGIVDDPPPGFGALGTDCDTGRPGACSLGSVICDADGVYACRQQPNDITGARAVDVCDGLDNDCDGVPDEDASVPLQPGELFEGLQCTAGEHIGALQLGECAASAWSCIDGDLICPQQVQPVAEICDGLDNDCDGTSDNGLRTVDPEVCLDPDNTCLVQGGLGICQTGVTACQQGAEGFEEACVPLIRPGEVQERCNGLDDDCDGLTDERPENGEDNCARTQFFQFGTNLIPESAGSADDDFGSSDIECTGIVNVRFQGNTLTVSTSITVIEADDPGDSTRGRWGASQSFDVGAPIAEVVSLTQTEVVLITEDENDNTVIENGRWSLDILRDAGFPPHILAFLEARVRLEEGQAGNPVDHMRIRIGDDLPDAGYWVNGTIDYRIRVTPGIAQCGNGLVEVGETCDDGNLCPGDGCSPACLNE